jgi:hypothetical protein
LPLNILQLESRCVIDEQSGLFHCVKASNRWLRAG